jgi:hypothetical protein
VIEAIGLLARQGEHLLRPRGEIAHGFFAHTGIILLRVGYFVQRQPEKSCLLYHLDQLEISRTLDEI